MLCFFGVCCAFRSSIPTDLVKTSLVTCMSTEDSMRPVVEKDALKEALSELLDEMPAFREWKKGAKPSSGQEAGPSDAAGSSRSSAATEM